MLNRKGGVHVCEISNCVCTRVAWIVARARVCVCFFPTLKLGRSNETWFFIRISRLVDRSFNYLTYINASSPVWKWKLQKVINRIGYCLRHFIFQLIMTNDLGKDAPVIMFLHAKEGRTRSVGRCLKTSRLLKNNNKRNLVRNLIVVRVYSLLMEGRKKKHTHTQKTYYLGVKVLYQRRGANLIWVFFFFSSFITAKNKLDYALVIIT